MNEIEELTDLLARRSVEHGDDGDEAVTLSFPHLVARLAEAGETDIAAKVLLVARRDGKHVETTPDVEAAAKRLRAEHGAETFREINVANSTDHPLPAWIRAEIGVSH